MKIGFLDTYYPNNAPEQENMKRYVDYFRSQGDVFEFLTPDGYFQNDLSKHINSESFDLILCTDASFPNMEILPDIPTFFVNWCPSGYLTVSHFRNYISRISAFDLMLPSCRTEEYDFLAENLTYGTPVARDNLSFFPSLSVSQMLKPKENNEYKLFYAGINRDTGNKKGRYYELFSLLDKTGFLELYGPNNENGVSCWQGFESAKGEIPFDGKSILKKINDAGVCLALNSPIHNKVSFITNRIFEACVAGAAIITDDNEFTKKYFSNNVFYVDLHKDENDLFNDVCEIFKHICENPEQTVEKIKNCQKIFKEYFSIEQSCSNLKKIYASYIERNNIKDKSVKIIAFAENKKAVHSIAEQITKQNFKNYDVVFAVSPSFEKDFCAMKNEMSFKADFIINDTKSYCEFILKNKDAVTSDYFVIIDENSLWQFRFLTKAVELLSSDDTLFSYSKTFVEKNSGAEILNTESFNFTELFRQMMNKKDDIAMKAVVRLVQMYPVSSFVFSKKLLQQTDGKIKLFNDNPHIYFALLSYLVNQDEGRMLQSVASGIKIKKIQSDFYSDFRRIEGSMLQSTFLAFHSYLKNKEKQNDVFSTLIKKVWLKEYRKSVNIKILYFKIKYFLFRNKKDKERIDNKMKILEQIDDIILG